MKKRSFRRSLAAFAEAQRLFPGGVNSPVRSFGGVGGTPVFMARGKGSHVWDIDGNEYIDYLGSWGPLILGHARAPVLGHLPCLNRRLRVWSRRRFLP
jgi:glutamate-1-semialdehyde 2,1-aminomutase